MAERPLYTLYKNLKAQNYDVPDDYNKFESALTIDGKGGADNRHAIYENLKAQNFDVPNTYERFYSALFEPRSRTSSRAKGGSVPMSAADRARFSAGASAISASAQQTMNNAGRYNRLKQRKQKQQKDFGRVNLGTHQTPYGGDANNVVKDDFAYNPETGKAGAYVTSDNENVYSQNDAEQKQNLLDKYGEEWNNAVDMGIVPSELDKAEPDLSDTEVAMRQMERRQEWINENQNRRSKELNESMHLQGSPFVASGGAVAPSSFNTAISNEANRLSDVEYGAYNTAKAYNQMLRTTLLQELKEQKQRNENAGWWKDKWNDVSNYFGAMFNTMLDPKLYSQGIMDAAISNNLLQVKKGMEDGTIKKGSNAGNAAQAMLGAIQQQQGEAAKQQQYGTKAYQYGDMSGRSLKFMADFALSGWRNVMTTGFTKAGEKVGEKMALGALGKWFTKNTGRVLGDIAGSAALAATNQLGSTYNNVIERYVGMNNENGGVTQDKNGDLKFNEGVSLGKAIKDGFGSATIENFSEMFGEYLPGASKLLSKLGLSKVSSFFEKIGNNAYYKWLSNATNKSGIQGVMAEISEEEFGTALHAAWGDGDGSWSDFNVFTNPDAREKQIDTCLGMFYSVGFMQAPRTAVGAINAVQYFNIKHQVAKADKFGQMMFNDKWDEIKSKIDVTTNADLTKTVLDATRSDSMTAKQKGAVINYAMFLSKLRGFNQAADAKTKDKVEEGDTAPTLSNDLDDAYTEGHNADDTDKHNIQLEQNDKANELAAMLHITPEQLHDMADEDLEAMTGKDDKLDQAIYDYQVSTAKYQGVMDGAQDEVDMAAHQAAMETDNMTDLSRGTVRKATIKATGGLEDYEVYIISGNIATHDDGSIDVGNSDDMIIYYDPTTGRKEHADAMMFADLIEELPAADVKAQAINDAKENAIKKIAGIIDGTVEVGSQFSVTDADGTEHTYEVLADNGDGTAMITIDGNVPTELVKGENVQIPYSLADLQQMKDMEDQKRLEAAKTEREQMEKERAAQQTQETEQTEETQPSFDFNQILNDNGNVVLADVLGKDGNTKYPNSQLFLIRDSGAKAKVMELKSDGSLVPHAVNKEDVATISSMSLDEYKQAMPATSMIEDNSGENRGEIEVEAPTIEGETAAPAEETAAPESTETPATEQTPAVHAITLEDGTIVPMLEDGNPDFSKLTAEQTAELYDSQFGEDADSIVSGYVSDAKKALDKASNMTVKGKTFVEQKAAKDAKEKAIADAQAAYDSAIAIRDAYNERQLAKVEDTAEGRKELIEKARRKFARLKSAVKDDAEAVAQIFKETVGTLLHRLYDGTGIDVTDTIPLTVEEYVASNLGAHSLNYEGTETSNGVKQETGLSREDFAKTQLLAADGKGTTIDNLVHSLWENRPSNLDSLDTQDIRNAMLSIITSGFKASEARNYIENLRIAQAENILEEQKKAADNAAFAEENKAESAQQTETAPESEEKTGEENSDEYNDEENEKINEQTNENINAPEVPEDATDEKPLGEQRTKSPFLVRENGKQQTETESDADVEKNKVDDMKVVDNIVGEKTRKTLEKIAKIMGANIQWLYSNKQFNGKFDEKTNTIYLTLDSSIIEGVQFIFGHEMTHEMRTKNPAAYDELKTLVKDMMGEDAFNSETDKMQIRYKKGGARYWNDRNAIEEEVVADQLGIWIRDANYAHTLLLKMSHPLLARLHEIVNSFLMALHGTEFSDDMRLILRSIEQAYVKTAKGEVTNSETGEAVSFSLRQKPEPKKKGIGYKVFVLKDGKLYPPMVANPNGAATPVGVWLDADAAPIAGESKTGRPQVKQGGKGTQGGSGKLAYRPGWHLGVVPYAIQFNRKDAEGNKTLFPKNFVFAEVEYAADVDYQEEARQEGINPSGKYQHSLAGLKHLPTDGFYMYRTNPNPETDPWVITGAMKVNRILTRAEQADLVSKAGREPQQIQEGDIVTDDVVNSINQEIADAPKFSLKVYHGSGADFTEFDFDHMGEGEGSQAFGWGGYVTSSKKIGTSYATLMDNDPSRAYYRIQRSNGTRFAKKYPTLESFLHGDKQIAMNDKFTEQEKIDYYNEMKKLAEPYHNLYEVDIPEDNGSNYLDWDKTLSKKQQDAIREGLVRLGVDMKKLEGKGQSLEKTGENVYNSTLYIGLTGTEYDSPERTKGISKFLSSVGFTGIKYKAGRNFGGAKKGDTNYVIFKPEDMKITEHTKFSIKTYHGSQASFDHFDHSFMGSGEGAQAYGWGTYVSEVEGIAKAYAKQNAAKHGMPREYKIAQIRLNHAKFEYDKVQRRYDNSKAYIDSLKEDLQNYRESIARRKEKVEYFAQNNMPETVDKLLKQIKRTEDTIKVTENDINMRTNDLEGWKPKLEEVKKKYEEEQKKFDAIPKPQIERNLYSVDIPDDTGENYIGWDEKMTPRMRDIRKEILEDNGYKLVDSDEVRDYFEDRDGKEYELFKEQYKTGGTFYEELAQLLHSQKLASLALKEYGFDGVKVIAQRNTGGNKEGKMNYVIFDENNAQITSHTKFSLRLKSAIEETETNPSDAQKESGNYKKGHIKFGGYDYTIENPKGSTRSGKDTDGKEWKVTMHDTYGYIRGKFGKDGDHLDMFINDKADLDNWDGDVFVVDQVNPDGSFDEHKVMYGYDSMDDAKKAYFANYSDGWQGLGNITGASKDEFDKWLDTSNHKLKPFADYAKVKFSLKDIKPVGVGAFGNIYNQFRGKAKAAIEFLKKLGSGEATAALHHHTIGDISLVWGDKKTGLDKILRKHPEVVDNLQSIIDSMEVVQESDNRIKLESPTHFAVVSKEYNGEPREQWLLTAYEKRESLENGKSMDTATSSLGGDTALSQSKESAAKIDNSSETTKENGEKFSLKDEKTMFGMHNISVDKLRKAIKQGGFAAPSMGVVDSKNGIYSDYGEITLIPKAEKLAKRTGKNAGTFTADAWTPTYPQVERIMNKQGEKAFNTDMNVKLGDVDNGIYSNVRESWKGYLSSGDVRDGLYWHYLFDKGMNPETIYQTGKYDNDITNEVMRVSDNGNKTDYTDKEVAELIQLMNKATGKDNDVDAQREKLKARIASAEKQGNHLLVALKKKRLEELEGVENFYIAADFVNDVVHNNRKNGKVDVHDTMGAAKKKVEDNKKLSDDFPSWLDKKTEEYGVEEMLYNGTTPSGKPKYIPNTIDNAVKLMKKQGVAGGYTAFGSELGVFIAKNSPEVNTLAAMKNAKDKLIPFGDERHNQIKDKITKEFLKLSDEIRVGSNNRYAFDDSGVSRMVELTDHKGNEKEYLKKAYNIEVSDEWMDRYNKLLDTIKKDYKVFYFETKFMRPYGLDEFEKAIVPSDTPSDVVDALKKAGIDVSSYERGNVEDRQKVTMDAINSSDNIRFSLAGERGAAAADKAEERTFRMDNLSVARKMEEEKKDAKAIKMATGWERGADGKWRYEMPDAKIKDTMDVGGGHIVKRYEDDMLWNGGKLSDVIDAPELFKAYPQLKDVRIDTDAIMNDMPSNGEYNSKTNTITIHADELKYMNGILNHEIQHAIQDIEGFAKGGSPTLVRGEVKKRFDEVTKQIRQLRAEGKEDEAKALIEKNRGLYNAYQKNDDYNSYKSLAGEVEARNVSARMNMTPEERRKTLAESTEDVARKDQIFLGVGDVSFSLRDMADGKESGAADMAEDLKSLNTPDEVDDAIKTAIEDMPSGWKMANKKMIHIAQALGENRKAEIAGEEPKFSLKDGTLIKAGTYFSGGGLVEEGLKGIIDPVLAVEYDEKISGVYRNNFGQHIVTADVRDVDPKELVKQIDGEVEYFHASPVCKNYSQAKSNHAEVELDKETAASTAEFINAIKPKVVTIENVKGYKDSDAMKTITDALDANGYTWDADVYNAADYGGYTNRERLIVRAVRDGKLPAKPKKMAHKSGWYEAVADIIPTLTEKKNGVANWMDIRLKADGIDWRNINKPLYVMGSAYADGKVPHAFADELLPTLRTKSGDVIVMPDGKVYRAMGRVLARVSGVSDDYKMPFSENLSHTIIGNGIPTQLTEHVIAPLLTGSDPKFSIRAYHGTGVSFDKFDLSHAFEGEGSETFGHGVYVTNSKKIGDNYAQRAKDRKGKFGFDYKIDMSADAGQMLSHYINKNQDVDKGLENARQDLKSALEMFPDDETLKELSAILQKNNNEIAEASNEAYLYDVDIPDDNGENYLGWNESQNFPLEKWYRLWEITHHGFNENEYFKDGGANYDKDRIERIIQMKLDSSENGMQKLPTLKGEELYHALEDFFDRERPLRGAKLASRALSEIGFVGIKYPAGMIHGGAEEGDYNYVIFDEDNANIVGNTKFSLRYDQFEHDLNQWKKDNNLPKDAQRPTIPQRNAGESAVDFLKRVDEYRKQMALWKTAPTYEQHLLSDDTALGEFNRELQRGSVLKRIAFQDSMLAIRKAQEAIMKEVGVDRLNMAEDAYTAENRSHGKGKNEFEEYNNEFLQPLRKAYHQMKKILGDSYDNVRIYMMAKHGLERDAQMAFKKSLDADFEDVAQRSAAYRAYKGDMNRITNDSDLEFGRVDFNTWRQRDNALRTKYSPSYMDYRYDENGIAYDYSGLSALFGGSDFEEAAHKLVRDIESNHVAEVQDLWNVTNAATKKILRDGYKAGMMSKDTYLYVRDMYSHYIPLRGWDGTTADQVWDYVGGGKGAFNQTLKTAHGRTSIADDPIAYIENMAESGILLNNKNWVKQHLMLLAQNHPTSLLTLSKAWYVKSVDANGNEEWIPATPQITSQMNSNQVKAAIDDFEQKMENMAQTGDATQQRDGLNIAYPQTHSEEREHEVRVMKDGEEYVIYVNGDPQLAQAMNNTRAHRVREIQSGKLDRAAAWLGRKMAAAYTSLSPLFIPSNYFRDLTMTLASTAIREDAKYNYLLRKNLATSWNLGFMLRDYQNGKLREKVSNGNATPKEQMFYDFMMNGGETGFVSSLDVEDLKKKFKNDLKDLDRWKTNPVKVGHTIMDSIEFLNRTIEDSNRFAVYMTSIQYGRSIDEAVNDAKDVTLNFNRKGTGEYGWQMIRNLYLFINPAVQSLQTLGALAKHHPFKFTAVTASWLASGVLVPIVNATLMSLLGGDDDKDKYWQFTKWDRRNNLIMWVPFTHEYVKIPLAQEFRAFYGVGDMIASKMMGGELAEESWSLYAEDLLGQVVDMLPLDPTGYDGNIAVSLMPNAIRPVFELAFNVDFTGKPLFKDTEYNKYDPNFTKAYVGTPDWLVRVSRMMNSIGNDYPDVQQNSIDAFGDPRYNLNNPAVVDHVLSSYLGGAYTMGSQVLGLLTKSLNDPKEIKVADIPLFSKFVRNPDDRPVTKKQGDEFWNMKENHDRAANTLSKLKKQAKVDGDYSMLERFYGSEEYKQYKQDDVKVKKYEEDKKKERAEESGEEYRPHKLNAEDIYKAHATPKDDFEDLKLKQLYTKLNGFKTSYDLLVDTAPSQSDGYYNTNKAAIDAIDEISLDKQEISELKKGFLDDGKDAYNAEDMKEIRELRKKILAVLEKANKVVVANQKAKTEK